METKFDADYEIRVLSASVYDEDFFPSKGFKIDPKYFSVPAHRKLWHIWRVFLTEYGEMPSQASTISLISEWKEKQEGFWSDADMKYLLDNFTKFFEKYENQKYVIDRFESWVKKQALEQRVSELVESVTEGDVTDVGQANEVLLAGEVGELFALAEEETEFTELFLNHVIEKRLIGDDDILPTGLAVMDSALGGGSKRGYKNIIMGPPGGGKTTAVTKMCAHLIESGLNVVYFFNDDTKQEILDRFGAILSGIGIDELADEHNYQELEQLVERLKQSRGNLYIQYIDPTTTPMQLKQIIAKKMKEGNRIDRVVVDHIRNMQPDTGMGSSKADIWERIGSVFLGLQAIPLQYSCDLWAVAHTKREAEGKDWISQEQIGLSYEPIKDANIVMAAWRLKQDMFKHTGQPDAMRFQICKRRGGPGLGERLRYEVDFPTHTFNYIDWDQEN